MNNDTNPWIGVDLDGTLAEYHGWKGAEHIGEPIPAMLELVKQWQSKGQNVKIFTARAVVPEQIPFVKAWALEHGLGDIEVVNYKDYGMIDLYDDRCHQVEKNTGRVIQDSHKIIADLIPLAEMAINGTPTGDTRNEMTEKVILACAAIAEKEVPDGK